MIHIQIGGAFTSRHKRQTIEAVQADQTVALTGRWHSLVAVAIELRDTMPGVELVQSRWAMGDGRTVLLVNRKGITTEAFSFWPRERHSA